MIAYSVRKRNQTPSLLAAITGKGKDEVMTPLAVLLKQTTITANDKVFPSIQKQVDVVQKQTDRTIKELLT